jgi:hypothetical protein
VLTDLLIGIHAGKAAFMAGMPTLARDLLYFLFGSVGKVPRILSGFGRHFGWKIKGQIRWFVVCTVERLFERWKG